ncbi:MAG TPA: phytanoyl-CoA dioxygenase family protein [Opitutaceae bacterium]|nr:phytanoyl-CoA dioxygenase family protein [Opitutaceae bacterium]
MLIEQGFELVQRVVGDSWTEAARKKLFRPGEAGTRCLLDEPAVRKIVGSVRAALAVAGRLPTTAVAIQAIAFDKTPDANWKVAWHQDLMFPFARRVQSEGYTLPSRKEEVDYARPPRSVLESLLAVRIHLDDCNEASGPLRVAPGSHRQGIIRGADVAEIVARQGQTTCLAKSGDALLMKPLLLHASSPASAPQRRRVLHLVYHAGAAIPEPWHRAI